jgi:hypothetical protein
MIQEPDKSMVQMIFLPLALATKEIIQDLQKDPPGLIYRYMREAGVRAVNGYPVFMSVHPPAKGAQAVFSER